MTERLRTPLEILAQATQAHRTTVPLPDCLEMSDSQPASLISAMSAFSAVCDPEFTDICHYWLFQLRVTECEAHILVLQQRNERQRQQQAQVEQQAQAIVVHSSESETS